jgi:hypothetical protein
VPLDNKNVQSPLSNECDNNGKNASRTDDIIHLDCSSPAACSYDDDDGG